MIYKEVNRIVSPRIIVYLPYKFSPLKLSLNKCSIPVTVPSDVLLFRSVSVVVSSSRIPPVPLVRGRGSLSTLTSSPDRLSSPLRVTGLDRPSDPRFLSQLRQTSQVIDPLYLSALLRLSVTSQFN